MTEKRERWCCGRTHWHDQYQDAWWRSCVRDQQLIIIHINEEQLNDDENFVNVRTDEDIQVEFVEDTINDFHK